MKRISNYLFVQQRHNWLLLFRFGLVGGTGVIVNLVVFGLLTNFTAAPNSVFLDLPSTTFNIRWYHVFSTLAFLVANVWNFQLNRRWTFASDGHASWWGEYGPFLLVGLVGQVLNLLILTALVHPGSWFSLPRDVFDDTSLLRDRFIWAQLIAVAVVTPLSFVLNKIWTFSAVRGIQGGRGV